MKKKTTKKRTIKRNPTPRYTVIRKRNPREDDSLGEIVAERYKRQILKMKPIDVIRFINSVSEHPFRKRMGWDSLEDEFENMSAEEKLKFINTITEYRLFE